MQEDTTLPVFGAPSTSHGMWLATLVLMASFSSLGFAIAAKAASNPFEQLSGDWTGGGTVTPAKGGPKKVDCNAT